MNAIPNCRCKDEGIPTKCCGFMICDHCLTYSDNECYECGGYFEPRAQILRDGINRACTKIYKTYHKYVVDNKNAEEVDAANKYIFDVYHSIIDKISDAQDDMHSGIWHEYLIGYIFEYLDVNEYPIIVPEEDFKDLYDFDDRIKPVSRKRLDKYLKLKN